MQIANGTRLGPYEIVAAIGAGGMGEVYRARDTRLGREVAVKILPAEFANDARLRLRFEREAKAISALTHPHICTLHDVGEANGVEYLVMELLEGESLARRLKRGALPIDEVLRYGAQIAEALDRAHRQGVVHRDLKPGNVMITRAGAKLLDFGLATTTERPEASVSATEQSTLTQKGTIVGTFQYMAPEQLEGLEVDARTDIFALGALLYEMTTGQRAFSGTTRTSLIAAIVDREPRPMAELQPITPPALEHVVYRCLRKQPDERWQSAFDVAAELRWMVEGGSHSGRAASLTGRRRGRYWMMWSLVTAVAAIAAAVALRPARDPARVVVSNLVTPPDMEGLFGTPIGVLSPDGTRIAYAAYKDGATKLWVRALDLEAAQPLAGTEGAVFPFWSPDGRSIGFFATEQLKRIDAAGGPVEVLAGAPSGRGGAWSGDGVIVFSPSASDPLMRVSAQGGEVTALTTLDSRKQETSHRFPAFAPDGRHFAFTTLGSGSGEGGAVVLASLDGSTRPLLPTADSNVQFAGDHVLYVRDRVLRAQRIDLEKGHLVGGVTNLAQDIQTSGGFLFSNFSVSRTGLIAYVSGSSATATVLKLAGPGGNDPAPVLEGAEFHDPRLSPDGKIVAYARFDAQGGGDIWTYDLARKIPTRLTFARSMEMAPEWSPDGKHIAYTSFEQSPGNIVVRRADGAGAAEVMVADSRRKVMSHWSPDGNYLLFHALSPGGQWDIETYSIPEKKIIRLLTSPFAERLGRFSRDGKWIAYASEESGRQEIYVQRFLDSAGKWQISSAGGTMPTWSADGKAIIFYSLEGTMMAASVRTGSSFSADPPRVLFPVRLRYLARMNRSQYDVGRDGRFILNTPSDDGRHHPITLMQNWPLKLQRK